MHTCLAHSSLHSRRQKRLQRNVPCDEAGMLASIQSPREQRRLQAVEQKKTVRAIAEQERWRRVKNIPVLHICPHVCA